MDVQDIVSTDVAGTQLWEGTGTGKVIFLPIYFWVPLRQTAQCAY